MIDIPKVHWKQVLTLGEQTSYLMTLLRTSARGVLGEIKQENLDSHFQHIQSMKSTSLYLSVCNGTQVLLAGTRQHTLSLTSD